MSKKVIPYKDSELGKKEQVTEMFDKVSSNYDVLNRVLTFGIDISWRKHVVALVKEGNAQKVLDIATGTGDLAIMMAKADISDVTGLDISPGMLNIGIQKVKDEGLNGKVDMVIGDSEKLPFEEGTFDAITVAFGVRNFENLELGLREILRVLKPKGTLTVLETSQPTGFPVKQGFQFYSKYVIPTIGKLFSKDKNAYDYLPESAAAFPYGEAFNNILLKTGFNSSKVYPQTLGVATIYHAIK
ncbi:bifunctional demethylmenaquinone methyltransferase/2-methoxy-6-polyprenyl-1,4-benzoquinol methylase UbiE [Lutimonas sp.]|jgi:demethylmenaquinone methyltransferase/2-methoxy-6-polyprenyl-1,4-benzoquinol methylase|uniref:bifunctional demethylmenaquinone methyltransferase/2-methoxy-6-polyprenyl-1,4-benzoquinol methylase UbiE n=1 Tax=Lutimonas sp. TaxID=1872403 RepID=UPI003C77992F